MERKNPPLSKDAEGTRNATQRRLNIRVLREEEEARYGGHRRASRGMKHGNFGNGPALVGAGDLELDHRDGVRGATHDTQTAANALLLVDNHIGAARPTLGELVQRISLDHAREPFHADTIVGADIDAAGAENADGGIDHDIQLTLQAA